MIKKIIDFITRGVWLKNERDYSGRKTWWLVRQFRIVIFTATGFGKHDTAIRSAALSFYTIMSLVPILALVFVIFKGFGMEQAFDRYLKELLPNYTELVDQILVFIKNLLARTQGGIMAVSAFFVLVWAVIQVFGNVESAFNKIWEVKRSRSFARRFTGYMALIIIVPILLLAANSAYLGIRTQVELFTGSVGAEILFGIASVVMIILMFAFVYYVIPNTTVKFMNALKSGIWAGIAFCIFQIVYIFIQGNLSSYNAIYGTFAAIPLFLLWLQVSWQILLFGGELSFALQNIRDFELEQLSENVSYENRCKIMIATMVIVTRNFLGGNAVSTPENISEEIGVPVRTMYEVANELESDGLLLFVRSEKTDKVDALVPARDPHSLRFFDVVNCVTEHGNVMPGLRKTALLERIDDTYEKAKGNVKKSGDNVLIIDLI